MPNIHAVSSRARVQSPSLRFGSIKVQSTLFSNGMNTSGLPAFLPLLAACTHSQSHPVKPIASRSFFCFIHSVLIFYCLALSLFHSRFIFLNLFYVIPTDERTRANRSPSIWVLPQCGRRATPSRSAGQFFKLLCARKICIAAGKGPDNTGGEASTEWRILHAPCSIPWIECHLGLPTQRCAIAEAFWTLFFIVVVHS